MTAPLLITGASGNIGRELTATLQRQAVPFETLSSRAGSGQRIASFEDRDALTQAFEGVHTLFVLLPLVPNKLQLAANVAHAAKAAGVKHIVRSSGAGADPSSPFALPRLQGQVDALLADTGLATTFLRPASFMQNYATFMNGMVRGGQLHLATADAAQSVVDVRDIADVAAAVLRNPAAHAGRAYTLTGGEALTDNARTEVLSRILGRPISNHFISFEVAAQSMSDMGWPPALVEWLDSLNRVIAAGYASSISPDVAHLLGREPRRFEPFVRDHLAAWA